MKIIAIAGSLRAASVNARWLRYLQRIAGPDIDIEVLDYADFPLFNADLIVDGELPTPVERAKMIIAAADGVYFATPEYNYGIPGPLKNAIDWLSRPAYKSVFAGKPVALLTVVPGPNGGARAQAHLKHVLSGMAAAVFPHPELALGGDDGKLDDDGKPISERSRRRLRRQLDGFGRWAQTLTSVTGL